MRYAKTKTQEAAAAKAGMALETAKKYLRSGGKMAQKKSRDYRTRMTGQSISNCGSGIKPFR
jgi:hypothetical protein